MQKRHVFLALVVVLFLVRAPLGFAQLGRQALPPHRTLGYYNSDTGLFEPLRSATQDLAEPAVTPTAGTLVYKFTITLKSPLPKNALVICSAGGAVIEAGYSADEQGFGIATLESGDTYTCSVSMPYSWQLHTASTDKIVLSYKAETYEAIQVTAANGTGTTVTNTAGRASSQTIAEIPVPANGATTTETVSVTL
jgi:hypothetical protein